LKCNTTNSYKSQLLTYVHDMYKYVVYTYICVCACVWYIRTEDVGDGMSAIVRHAVQQVVMGKNRNCCCCLPYTYTAGRRVSHARNGTMDNEGVGSKCGARVGGEVHVELVAALYANEIDENIHRVAILDLDGRCACVVCRCAVCVRVCVCVCVWVHGGCVCVCV